MGLPDFLKYAVRSAPDSLTPTPSGKRKVSFDYVLIDATNVSQTVGFDQLFTFLMESGVIIKKAIIFAIDSQRDRTGTARHHRLSRSVVGDLDVTVQDFISRLTKAFTASPSKDTMPQLLMSGRGVAGEADYKMLSIQRTIIVSSWYHHMEVPTFLFVSEDSDILCGAICGPVPQNSFIATSLHDTTFRMNILRVSHVVTYISACVDAFASSAEADTQQAPQQKPIEVRPTPPPAPPAPIKESEPEPEEEDIVRRKKKDGPMIATGVREVLGSDSDEDEEDANEEDAPQKEAPLSAAPEKPIVRSITSHDLAAGRVIHSSMLDFVFLFQVIMGNGESVPPLVRGVTKVDVHSCWSAYCRQKYAGNGGMYGKTLFRIARSPGKHEATATLNAGFLYEILESVHYTDCVSRAPVEEEKTQATNFFTNAVWGVLRFIVGCNITGGSFSKITETFLDSRPSTQPPGPPSLAAVLWVLQQHPTLTFSFSLSGTESRQAAAAHSLCGPRKVPEQMDVPGMLVSPSVSSSWAIRSAGSKTVTVEDLLTSGSDRSKLSLASMLLSSSWMQDGLPEHIPVPSSACEALVNNSVLSISKDAASFKEIGSKFRFVSPLTGRMVIGPLSASTREGEHRSEKDQMAYSFELRRMAPLMSGAKEQNEAKNTAAQNALLAACGVSLAYEDYKEDPAAAPVLEVEAPKKKRRVEQSEAQEVKPKKGRPGKKERNRRKAAAAASSAASAAAE